MFKFGVLNFILISFLSIDFAKSQDCESIESRVITLKSAQANIPSINLENTDIVFLGEHHLHSVAPFINEFLGDLKQRNQQLDCFFMEINRNVVSLPVEAGRFYEIDQHAKANRLSVHYVDWKSTAPHPKWFLDALNLIKILPQEDYSAHAKLISDFNLYIAEQAQIRNDKISERIRELMRGGFCTKAVGLFGSAHLNADGLDGFTQDKTLHSRLVVEGFAVKSYELLEPYTYVNSTNLGSPQTLESKLKTSQDSVTGCGFQDLIENIFPTVNSYIYMHNIKEDPYSGTFFIPQN